MDDNFINDILNDISLDIQDDDDTNFRDFLNNFDEIDLTFQNKIPFKEFCKKLYELIDPHDTIIITTRMLLMVEKAFAQEFGVSWNKLKRDDKRKKERILQKFYENSDTIIMCIQNEPDKYLRYVREIIVKKLSKR